MERYATWIGDGHGGRTAWPCSKPEIVGTAKDRDGKPWTKALVWIYGVNERTRITVNAEHVFRTILDS